MSIVNVDHLEYYAKLNYNVLLSGLHGIGKTAVVKTIFNKLYGTRWRYFSAPTLDPWVDFVGVPETVVGPDGKRYLELIRPQFIAEDQVEALFFDELNRSSDKVQNAIMELTQFKTINGHPLKNLKVIWGAVNPGDDDETYKVNEMDPAFVDRFQVHINMPYRVDDKYFQDKYPGFAKQFIEWWKALPEKEKLKVSPRRLDAACDAYLNQCRLEDFLPHTSGIKALRDSLKAQPFAVQIKSVTNAADAEKLLKDVNNATKMLDMIKAKDPTAIDFFESYGKQLPKELTDPYVMVVYAQSKGMNAVSSMKEMIDKLPNDRGTQATAAMINGVDFALLYRNGGSMEKELRDLHRTEIGLVKKLATRIMDIFMSCQVATLSKLLWGSDSPVDGKATNLQELAKLLSKIDRNLYTSSQRTAANAKLYQPNRPEARVIQDENWL